MWIEKDMLERHVGWESFKKAFELTYEPTPHKSVDYRAFKRGFQASRKQSQSLHMKLIK
jgi:hypothetical protein